MNNQIKYQPGVCNIGPEEIKRRIIVGHSGSILTKIGRASCRERV